MVKFANKAKGRPSKRRTFKVKYKIERKVKQHIKRVKKEAKKLKGRGLKHKGQARSDFLPNMFPFKQQILQQAKQLVPKQTEAEVYALDQSLYGLINLENKCQYLPKPRQNLIKKYVTNLVALLENTQMVLELLEARNPQICIDDAFRKECQAKKIPIISIVTKCDLLSKAKQEEALKSLEPKCSKVFPFSTDHKVKSNYLEAIAAALKEAGTGNVLVAGKSLTGKHTFITSLAKHLGKYHESPYELNLIKLSDQIKIIDSPFRIVDGSGYPLFTIPNPVLEESIISQEQGLVRRLFFDGTTASVFKKDLVLEHFNIQEYLSVVDLLTKIGKSWKVFGKGGSIDVGRVRNKIISEWFTGKLINLLG